MQINTTNSGQTMQYAAEELARYIGMITCQETDIRLELMTESPAALDTRFDDAISIDIKNGSGVIAGLNPRSALIGVYRYLTELGCRWVRPGDDGEVIPKLESLPDVTLEDTASYRHRGVCIEGSVSEEHLRDIINWMPKLGFNAYFIQMREAYPFFNNWYGKHDDPYATPENMPVAEADMHTANVVAEIKKRDMLYHAVGHGWTSESLGISTLGWQTMENNLPEEITQYMAEVNGERKLWYGAPLNTNLCYGNPKARQLVVSEIVNHLKGHSEIDVLHFWLADASNNNCECELCRDTLPSDLYIEMLNSLDEELTAAGIDTRIVFLIYVDLMWPPVKNKIKNPERFILMFAPITRSYRVSFKTDAPIGEPPPFERNKLVFPSSVEENIAFLKAWQKSFQGDSFDFDYHMWSAHYNDPSYYAISNVLSQDANMLKNIGLNGIVSCQAQRVFFPTGLPMTVMGRTLWNRDLGFDDIASDYFNSAFGPDGAAVRSYLEELSGLLNMMPDILTPEATERFAKVAPVVDAFAPTIQRNLSIENPCWAKSWDYLQHYSVIAKTLAQAFELLSKGEKENAIATWEQVKKYVWDNRAKFNQAFDVFMFQAVLGGHFQP